MMIFKQSEDTAALRRVPIVAVDATDGITPEDVTFGVGEVLLIKNGGAPAATTATAVKVNGATGDYYVELTAAELDTLGYGIVMISKSGVRSAKFAFQVIAANLYNATNLGLSNINATISSRSSHDADDVWDDADGIETGLTPRQAMRALLAVLAGHTTGAGTGTEVFRNAVVNSKARVTTTMTGANRTGITYDLD